MTEADTRAAISAAIKESLKARDALTTSTLRLALAALKDKDIAARDEGESVDESAVLALLQSMIKQRRESAAAYRDGGRADLAEREEAEITVLQRFLPQPLEGVELESAVDAAVAGVGAATIKDMGRVLAALRERYPGQVDAKAAAEMTKARLTT